METKNKSTQDSITFWQVTIQPYYLGLLYYIKMLSFKDIFAGSPLYIQCKKL